MGSIVVLGVADRQIEPITAPFWGKAKKVDAPLVDLRIPLCVC